MSDDINIVQIQEKNDNNEILVKFYQKGNEDKSKYLEFNIKVEENLDNDNLNEIYEREYEFNLEGFIKKMKLIIYSRCIIVNKSDYLLYIKETEIKDKNFDTNSYDGKLFPKRVN